VIDDGQAIHYLAVPRGTPVYGSDEVEVGVVEAMLDNYREHIFDGVVFKDPDGVLRFADAPEVSRAAERMTPHSKRCRRLRPAPSIHRCTARHGRSAPGTREHRSLESASGSIGTTRSGK